jgi:hypothetical protein
MASIARTDVEVGRLKVEYSQSSFYADSYYEISSFFLFGLWGCSHSWPIVPASGDSDDDCGEADGM